MKKNKKGKFQPEFLGRKLHKYKKKIQAQPEIELLANQTYVSGPIPGLWLPRRSSTCPRNKAIFKKIRKFISD